MKLAVLCVLTFGFTLSDHFHPTESSIIPSNNDWISFQRKHILNPDEEEPDFYDWKARQWRKWFFRRRPEVHPSVQQSLNAYYGKFAPFMTLKLKEVVVISRPEEVAAAFRGNLMQYGTKNQALVWSTRSFPTFIFQKAGRRLRVFDCGEMFIAARLLNGYPSYLHDFYPIHIRNPLGGLLRLPVSRYCRRIRMH